MLRRMLPCLLIALFTCACLFGAQAATPTVPAPTATLTATLTVEPSQTPEPTQTPTDVPTDTPTATTAPTDTPQPTATLTATPQPTAQTNTGANLREGPGVVYPVIQSVPKDAQVQVLERDANGDWFHIQTSDGKDGWLSKKVITFTFDPMSIPLASVIPPTPVYTMTPAATDTSVVPTSALPQNVHLKITNGLNILIYIYLKGPQTYNFTIKANSTQDEFVTAGSYQYDVSASGYNDLTGTHEWSAGDYTWNFTPK